jgi:hypothetical protein
VGVFEPGEGFDFAFGEEGAVAPAKVKVDLLCDPETQDMRGYICGISQDDSVNAVTIRPRTYYAFCKELKGACCWPSKDHADYELSNIEADGKVTHETGIECSDFRVEQRAENEFVISCEGPNPTQLPSSFNANRVR